MRTILFNSYLELDILTAEPFSTRGMKLHSKPDGFLLYGKLAVDFFPFLIFSFMEGRRQQNKTTNFFYMITDNPNVSPGIVDRSLYTRGIAL